MRRIVLVAALLLFAWGVTVQLTGGINTHVLGIAIRSREPVRALLSSLTILVLLGVFRRAWLTAVLDRVSSRARAWSAAIVLMLGLALAVHGVVFGSFGVGGSDSYGYVNQAYDWVSGALPKPLPLPITLPFQSSDYMQAPLGYRVGQTPHTIVPTYAPGLPLMMAVSLAFGSCGPYFVVPLFSVLFVWFTFRLGRLVGGAGVGVIAAIVLVTAPVVLYQALWPMSDIPAGALWTASIVYALGGSRRRAAAAGVCTALGLLVRPNLLLVPVVPLLVASWNAAGRERWIRAALVCGPSVPVAVIVAILNTLWYGAPTNSGYGSTDDLYLLSNVWPNVKLYTAWLWESQSPWVLLALLPLLPPFASRFRRGAVAACVLLGAATFASYVTYSQFEVWWYLRFLMPAFGALAVLIAAALAGITRVVPQPFGRIAAATMLYLMVLSTVSFAASKLVFGAMRDGERRYITISEFVADELPPRAALFAQQHSGSLRFYTGRITLRYDSVEKEWAAGVPAAVERIGYHPYLVVDDWELPDVRSRFGVAPDAPLPWPIVARMRELGGVTIFDMATSPGVVTPTSLEPVTRHWCAPRQRGPI